MKQGNSYVKSNETREVAYTNRYSRGYLIPTTVMVIRLKYRDSLVYLQVETTSPVSLLY